MRNRTWSKRDSILFFERCELYLLSGLPIDRCLQIIEEGSSKKHTPVLRNMRLSIESGHSLTDSFGKTLAISETIRGVIHQGEMSGRLAESMRVGRLMLEHGEELRKKLTSAMAYPIIIGVFALFLIIGLVRGVMPQIIPMLKSLHVELPLLTRIVIAFSENIISFGLYIFLCIIACVSIFIFLYKKWKLFRYAVHSIVMRIPIAGKLIVAYTTSLFLQSCGSLIETGSSSVASYTKASHTLGLLPLRSTVQSKINELEEGNSLHKALMIKGIPSFIPSLIAAGEISGTLGSSMIRAAAILDRDIEHSLKKLTALVEPVMMAGMGLVVGSIALSIMMPIYEISKVLQK